MSLHPTLSGVTDRIIERSALSRKQYLSQMRAVASKDPYRSSVSCGNLAHAAAACPAADKSRLAKGNGPNIAIVTAYNDMLSAHQPLGTYPDTIKSVLADHGATAQIAGGVPAMCDGVTQGQPGMDLSLFSRDVIAMATAISLSHNVFDGAIMLGVCDKIVPGLFIGAARFGHLPIAFLPAGPMPSGLSNREKACVRQDHAAGKIGTDKLYAAEAASYHSPGTCTFYGTANSNQMLMEVMGLHVPGSAFVNPGTNLRRAIIGETAKLVANTTALGETYTPFYNVIDERAIVNAIVGLNATGGSTNHTLHLIAMARTVGVRINWTDFSDLSSITPLLARIYPNGSADVNDFHAAGGLAFVIRELIAAGLLHPDVATVSGHGLDRYAKVPKLTNGQLKWHDAPKRSGNLSILSGCDAPFHESGGLAVLDGNIGRAVIKVSAVSFAHRKVTAPALVFKSQQAFTDRFGAGELNRDFVAVIPFQGPRANGMPELHKLTPMLSVLQNKGFRVALITDGRMSGASGKVPAAIHMTPEALNGGPIGKIRDGDVITLNADEGVLHCEDVDFDMRTMMSHDIESDQWGSGRELFAGMRALVGSAEDGAMTLRLFEARHV